MLNPEIKLNEKMFDSDVELKSTRQGFGEGILIAGDVDKKVVALCADLTESTCLNDFRKKFPERFIEMGVAEQNMASVASGLAASGKIPFMASFAIFSPGRNWEQIRTTICYNNVPVKIIGSHAGISVGPDGGSHQALEDIAITRVIPRLTVISPCDFFEAKKCVIAAAKTKDATYIRLSRESTPTITSEHSPFEIGKASLVWNGMIGNHEARKSKLRSVGIIATGPILFKALLAARLLENDGIYVHVLNLSSIKPLDEHSIIRLAHETGALVTVEDHQICGGMGSAVAECLSKHRPTPMEYVGVDNQFGQSGNPAELYVKYEMTEKHIYHAAKKVLIRK